MNRIESLDDSSVDQLLALAGAVEQSSEHPIARGIVNEAKKRDLKFPSASDFSSTKGKGVSAKVDGLSIRL